MDAQDKNKKAGQRPPKMKIINIGNKVHIVKNDSLLSLSGGNWVFDGSGIEGAVGIYFGYGDNDETYFGGYTAEELNLIHEYYHRGRKEVSLIFKIKKFLTPTK